MKKSQGLSLQTIVIAVLALFVLVVLIVIFSGKSQPAAEFGTECSGPPTYGTPTPKDDPCPEDKPTPHPLIRGEDGKKCCVEGLV